MKKILTFITIVTVISFIIGCELIGELFSEEEDNYSWDSGTVEPINLGIFDAANNIIPSFEESTRAISTDWDDKSATKVLFMMLQKFDPVTDMGILDGSNLFAFIYDANESVGNALAKAKRIDSTLIQEPFEFGNDFFYDHAINDSYTSEGNEYNMGYAYKVDGEQINVLATSGILGTESNTLGQIQGYYNPDTGDMKFDMIYLVDYVGSDENYSVRGEVFGNEITHNFEMTIATSGGAGELGTSISGKGISEGDNAYFLIKMNDGEDMVQNGVRYYIFNAESDETTLKDMNVYGYKTETAYEALHEVDQVYYEKLIDATDYGAISAYIDDVESQELFTIDDMPTSLNDFNNGDISLTFVELDIPEEDDDTAYIDETDSEN